MVALGQNRTHAPQQKAARALLRKHRCQRTFAVSDPFEAVKLVASNANITQGPPGDHFRVLVCRVPS